MKLSRLVYLIALIIVAVWLLSLLFRVAAWLINGLFYVAALIVIIGLIAQYLESRKRS